jgi:hypothetical protein
MKTTKINGHQVQLLKTYQAARAKKNEGTREEKAGRKAVDAAIPDVAQKLVECSLMFDGTPAAIWKQTERTSLDEGKLQKEFPAAYKACYLPGKVWSLDVLV